MTQFNLNVNFNNLRVETSTVSLFAPPVPPLICAAQWYSPAWRHRRGSARQVRGDRGGGCCCCCLLFCWSVLCLFRVHLTVEIQRRHHRKTVYSKLTLSPVCYSQHRVERVRKRQTWNGCSKRITPWVREEGDVILIRVVKMSTSDRVMDWEGFYFVLWVLHFWFNGYKIRLLNAHTGLSFGILFGEEAVLLAICVDSAQTINIAVNVNVS